MQPMKIFAHFNIIFLVLCSKKEYEKLVQMEKTGFIVKLQQGMALKSSYKKLELEKEKCLMCKKENTKCRCVFEPKVDKQKK